MMLDHQRRNDATGFQQNGDTGKRIHASHRLGQTGAGEHGDVRGRAGSTFRVASKPAAEARMWMIAGIAGGIQPWWHHVGAYHEDRRMYQHRRAGDAVAQGERSVPRRPRARRHRRRRVVAAETRTSSAATMPPNWWTLRTTDSCAGARPGAHSLPAGARRRHRTRMPGDSACWYCRISGATVRCAVRGGPAIRRSAAVR